MKSFDVYCDESCHLKKDNSDVMVLGSLQCLEHEKQQIYNHIRDIKSKHGLSTYFEIKWTKVSESKIEFYLELLHYFFSNGGLSYRGLVASGKSILDHERYNNGDYDLWYYKMYFLLLDPVIKPIHTYRVFIDIKDTRGGKRVSKLREVLCNNIYDFKGDVIKSIYQVDSRSSELIQLVDLINGALTYYHRHLYNSENSNNGKNIFISKLEEHINLDLTTSRNEEKFNMIIWKPQGFGGRTDE